MLLFSVCSHLSSLEITEEQLQTLKSALVTADEQLKQSQTELATLQKTLLVSRNDLQLSQEELKTVKNQLTESQLELMVQGRELQTVSESLKTLKSGMVSKTILYTAIAFVLGAALGVIIVIVR